MKNESVLDEIAVMMKLNKLQENSERQAGEFRNKMSEQKALPKRKESNEFCSE